MKAGNEIKKGWMIDTCPKCGMAWGYNPVGWVGRIDPQTDCPACRPDPPASKELTNTEFCEDVRERLSGKEVWTLLPSGISSRETYTIDHLEYALARLEKAEKKMSTMMEAPSYFPPGAIYDPLATAPDISASISIKRCPNCAGRGEIHDDRCVTAPMPTCTYCHGSGYIVVGKGKA